MHLFKWAKNDLPPRKEITRIYEHKLYIAKENHGDDFDLSRCYITKFPPGLDSIIKVLLKKNLYLNNNLLKNLDNLNFSKINMIVLLDLSNNKLKNLPQELSQLRHLKHLIISHNEFVNLPICLSKLHALESLQCEDNQIILFPNEMCDLSHLKLLNIQKNMIQNLPQDFYKLHNLKTLNLDTEKILFPPQDVCQLGLNSIRSFLLDLLNDENLKQEYLSLYEKSPSSEIDDNDSMKKFSLEDDSNYKKRKELAKKIEKEVFDKEALQNQLLARAHERNNNCINEMRNDEMRKQLELERLQKINSDLRKKNIEIIRNESLSHVDQIIKDANKNRDLLKEKSLIYERKMKEDFELWKLDKGKNVDLRKEEILASMKEMLEKTNNLKPNVIVEKSKILAVLDEEKRRVAEIETSNHQKKDSLLREIMNEETKQKEAFQRLQLSSDELNQNLCSEIGKIQAQLIQLTNSEVSRKHEEKSLLTEDVLHKKRQELCQVLKQLYDEKDKRAQVLKEQLEQYHEHNQKEFEDFWLVQYQRLMDKKPISLLPELDERIQKIMIQAGANLYMDELRKRSIDYESFLLMNDDDLRRCDINNSKVRSAIISITSSKSSKDSHTLDRQETLMPTAPVEESQKEEQDKRMVTNAFISQECCICLDNKVELIYLPCGHASTCSKCGSAVKVCPLCRKDIEQLVVIEFGFNF